MSEQIFPHFLSAKFGRRSREKRGEITSRESGKNV
jgi:hypothetical protein